MSNTIHKAKRASGRALLESLPTFDRMPTADELDARIDELLALGSRELIDNGRDWYYAHAPMAIADISEDTGADMDTVAGMLAAMSAGYSWADSLEHVYKLLVRERGDRASTVAKLGEPLFGGTCAGPIEGIAAPYGWRAIAQAEAIRDGVDPFEILRNGKGHGETVKRWNFAANLMGDLTRVTIDVHMTRGLTGGFRDTAPDTPNAYNHLADAVRRAADRHGMEPAEMQAVLWSIIRGEAH